MKNKSLSWVFGLCVFASVIDVAVVNAEGQYAGKERATVAKAHMSRARTLLVEALEEFEEARKYARPDLLLDSEDWRLRVISLTEQLNRVIDPRPRVTREGAVFRVPPRLIKRERDNLPVVADGAKSRSDYGERAKMEGKQDERARMFSRAGDKKEPLRIVKNGATNELPADLAVPDELPVLKESQDPLKKKNSIDEKALFTQELLPQIEAGKEAIAEKEEVKKEVPIVDVMPPKDMDAEVGENLPAAIEDKSTEVKEEVKVEVEKEADLGVEDVSDDVTRKQLNEDDELTKRLDETISNRTESEIK
jgi:hypothetical protein